MKKLLLAIVLLLAGLTAQSQGIQFTEGSWSEILQKAKLSDKPVFVDIYTTWCGPCKKMATEVFTQPQVGEFFNERFICYKLDAEKGEGINIASRYGVTAYPTCLFISPEGELIYSFRGFRVGKLLIEDAKKAENNYRLLPQLKNMDASYQKGERDKDFLLNYCITREKFGRKGGLPLLDLVQSIPDSELIAMDAAHWIKSLDIYDETLANRLIDYLKNLPDSVGKKTKRAYNDAIMNSLSICINQAIDKNDRGVFDKLMQSKQRMAEINPSNNDNGVSASIGGGIAYIATEQVQMTFYMKNKYNQEFSSLFLNYLGRMMHEYPTDSLIAQSNAEEKAYSNYLKSDTVTDKQKEELRRGRDMMNLFKGVKTRLLSSTLYNAAEYYWKLHQPATPKLKADYVSWLQFFYALDRGTNIGIPAAQKLAELGEAEKGKAMLKDLAAFLKLSGNSEKEIEKVNEALREMK